jgi:prepilin-type N-terminal cleavage/methylation domain-containing protein
MMRRADSSRLRGFTLIEMLAVVALLGLISSVAVVSLTRVDGASAMQSARWGLMNLDAQARIAARTQESAAIIRVLDGGSRLAANLATAHEGAWSASLALPHGTVIRFLGGQKMWGQSLDGLYIDRIGRSADATIEIAGQSGQSERWLLHGVTGQFSRLDSAGGI